MPNRHTSVTFFDPTLQSTNPIGMRKYNFGQSTKLLYLQLGIDMRPAEDQVEIAPKIQLVQTRKERAFDRVGLSDGAEEAAALSNGTHQIAVCDGQSTRVMAFNLSDFDETGISSASLNLSVSCRV